MVFGQTLIVLQTESVLLVVANRLFEVTPRIALRLPAVRKSSSPESYSRHCRSSWSHHPSGSFGLDDVAADFRRHRDPSRANGAPQRALFCLLHPFRRLPNGPGEAYREQNTTGAWTVLE